MRIRAEKRHAPRHSLNLTLRISGEYTFCDITKKEKLSVESTLSFLTLASRIGGCSVGFRRDVMSAGLLNLFCFLALTSVLVAAAPVKAGGSRRPEEHKSLPCAFFGYAKAQKKTLLPPSLETSVTYHAAALLLADFSRSFSTTSQAD